MIMTLPVSPCIGIPGREGVRIEWGQGWVVEALQCSPSGFAGEGFE